MRRWLRLVVVALAVAVSLALLAMPVSSKPIRLAQLVVVAVGATAALSLAWASRWARVAAGAALLGSVGFLFAPGRAIDEGALRAAYVAELSEMVGVPYVWGGEGRRGIDCSGLPRKALLDATLERGLATANPTMLRRAVALWWNDTSAKALGTGHRGTTVPVTSDDAIRTLDEGALVAGDLAVTADGVHLLVYLGAREWIQADPLADEVIVVERDDDNAWLTRPVNVVRWRTLG